VRDAVHSPGSPTIYRAVTPFPLPTVPWQTTGNHWLALPCIHPADGSIRAVGIIHRGARGAIELAGDAGFLDGRGAPLVAPSFEIDGTIHQLSEVDMAWERAFGWVPMFTATLDSIVIRGTIFSPFGRDGDIPAAIYALSLENRGSVDRDVVIRLGGVFGHQQLRVQTPRPLPGDRAVTLFDGATVVMEGTAVPAFVALAVAADEPCPASVEGQKYELRRTLRVAARGREQCGFFIACAPERDAALATVEVLRRRGWRDLLAVTREGLRSLEQSTGNETVDRLINRNLLFAYFFGAARALDDAHYYVVRTRAPWHSAGVTVRDWEALMWTLPAIQLADPPLARELLLRICELHGYAPGRGSNYLDGTLFAPGFNLESVAAYAIAIDRYIRDANDDRVVDDPLVAETLYLVNEDIERRRDERVPLYSTDVTLSGGTAPMPYMLHGNAAVAQALDVLRRTLDEETAARIEDPEVVRSAIRRHFVVNGTYVAAVDLTGGSVATDDPAASLLWLPFFEAVSRDDSTYRRTAKSLASADVHLALQCARLLGPESAAVLEWLRRAPLDGGIAAEVVDADGKALMNGGDAALSGLVAWSAWYAVHALGQRI
jgi:hypothetical protein